MGHISTGRVIKGKALVSPISQLSVGSSTSVKNPLTGLETMLVKKLKF